LDIQMTHILIEFWMNLKLKVSQKRIFRRSCIYKLFDEISRSKSAITLSKLLI
jgi:hypothetical protein